LVEFSKGLVFRRANLPVHPSPLLLTPPKHIHTLQKALRKTTFNKNRSKTSMLDLGEIVSKLEAKANADKSVADVAPFSSPPKAPSAPAAGNG